MIGKGLNVAFGAINTFFKEIDWARLGNGLAKGLNGLVDSLDWSLIGETVGNGINAVVDLFNGFLTEFDFIFDTVNWPAIGELAANGVNGFVDVIHGFVHNAKWEKYGSDLSSTEHFDTSSAIGRAMIGILGVFAQMERELTSERVKAAIAERARQGKPTCFSVLGYNYDSARDVLVINPDEAEQVRYIFEMYLRHRRILAVADLCRAKGMTGKCGGALDGESIRKILSSPVCAGYHVYHGSPIKGSHDPIIDRTLFNRVQRIMAGRNDASGRKRQHQAIFLD